MYMMYMYLRLGNHSPPPSALSLHPLAPDTFFWGGGVFYIYILKNLEKKENIFGGVCRME